MAFRDFVKIGSRVLGAVGGAIGAAAIDVATLGAATPFINPVTGAMAGYGIGATVGDLAAGKVPTKTVNNVAISPFGQNAGIERNPSNRITNYQTQQSNPGWSDKIAPVMDTAATQVGTIYNAATNSPTKKWSVGPAGSNINAGISPDITNSLSGINNNLDAINNMNKNIYQNNLSVGNMPKLYSTQSGQIGNF